MKILAPAIVFFLVLLVFGLLPSTRGHGFLGHPPARNVLANSDYCPHCLNMGTTRLVSNNGKLRWPEGLRGICGDPFNGPRPHEEGGKYYGGGTPVVTYARGGIAEIEVYLTTNHYGRFRFRVCKIDGGRSEKQQLTESCLEHHVLKQANIPQAQRPGDEWFYTSPSDPSTTLYTMYYQLPEDLVCDGESASCVLQWYWVSANSCNPPEFPAAYKLPYGLEECTAPDAPYPEEFINCADIAIVDTRNAAAQYAILPSDIAPVVVYGGGNGSNGSKSVRFIDPVSNRELEDTSRVAKKLDKTLAEKAAARSFCASQPTKGTFANPADRCSSYFVCSDGGSWYFECPIGTSFDPNKKRCALQVPSC